MYKTLQKLLVTNLYEIKNVRNNSIERDEFSDLDITVIISRLPSREERKNIYLHLDYKEIYYGETKDNFIVCDSILLRDDVWIDLCYVKDITDNYFFWKYSSFLGVEPMKSNNEFVKRELENVKKSIRAEFYNYTKSKKRGEILAFSESKLQIIFLLAKYFCLEKGIYLHTLHDIERRVNDKEIKNILYKVLVSEELLEEYVKKILNES